MLPSVGLAGGQVLGLRPGHTNSRMQVFIIDYNPCRTTDDFRPRTKGQTALQENSTPLLLTTPTDSMTATACKDDSEDLISWADWSDEVEEAIASSD